MYQLDLDKCNRIFTFGCSYTNFAWDTWANLLASQFPDKEFYNFGKSGVGNYYIANMLMQVDEHYNFTSSDLVLICWSFPEREDRIIDEYKGNRIVWTNSGSVYSSVFLDENFINKYANPVHYQMQSLTVMKLVENFFKSKQLDYAPFITNSLHDKKLSLDQPYDHPYVLSRHSFKDMIHKVQAYPSMHEILWNDDITVKERAMAKQYKDFRDTHPSPQEHADVLKAVFDYQWNEPALTERVQQSTDAMNEGIASGDIYTKRWRKVTYESMPTIKRIIR